MRTIIIPIGGMTCAACSARVERALARLGGVESAAVNLASEKARVVYDPRVLGPDALRGAVVKAGYTVRGNADAAARDRERALLKARLAVASVFALPLLYIAMAPMLPVRLPFPAFLSPMKFPLVYALTELLLTLPIVIAGGRFYTAGFKNLFRLSPNMDSLIALGTGSALLFSLYNVMEIARGNHMAAESLYFESAGVIVALILLGKYLETSSKHRAGAAVKKLVSLAPRTAIVVSGNAAGELTEREIPADDVVPGDIVIVKPGARFPVDGIVTEGRSAADESMLSGESIPVEKKPGDTVYGASVNANGVLRFRAEKVGPDTALARIIRLVEEAQGSKAPIARLADIVAGYFVPVVCGIAVFAGLAWFAAVSAGVAVPPAGKSAAEFALTVFISVLVIACPCALGLATPTAIMVGTGKGAEHGILIKSGEALETAHGIKTIVFDKTGTVTEGKPVVTDLVCAAGVDEYLLLGITASAEKDSGHPVGAALAGEAEKRGLVLFPSAEVTALPGMGIEAVVPNAGIRGGGRVLAGSRKLMDGRGVDFTELLGEGSRLAAEGKTLVYAAFDGRAAGIIAVADVVKKTSKDAVTLLGQMGIAVVMMTGDNAKTAAAIAGQTGIGKVLSEVLPADKAAEVKKLQDTENSGAAKKKRRFVAMVGDGINDAPALAQADIGIAVGSGTDAAIESADIVLMKSDIADVPRAIELSRRTIRTIKQNLFWAFAYNVLGIPVAAGALYLFGGPLLNPMIAAAAMSMSSVSVLANALRLKRIKL